MRSTVRIRLTSQVFAKVLDSNGRTLFQEFVVGTGRFFGRRLQRLRPVRHHLGAVGDPDVVTRDAQGNITAVQARRWGSMPGSSACRKRRRNWRRCRSRRRCCTALRDASRVPRQQREQRPDDHHHLAVRAGIGPTRHRCRRRPDRRLPGIRPRRLGQREHAGRLLQAVLLRFQRESDQLGSAAVLQRSGHHGLLERAYQHSDIIDKIHVSRVVTRAAYLSDV